MPRFVVIEGPNRGAIVRVLPVGGVLGRDRGAAIALPDEAISRRHAELVPAEGGGLALRDLESKNATWLNGVRVRGDAPLATGDEVRLGGTVLLYVDEVSAAAAHDGADAAAPGEGSSTRSIPLPAAGGANLAAAAAPGPAPRRPHPSATPGANPARTRYLIGDSAPLRKLASAIARLAPLDTTVLVLGETGTGKELVAEALHRLSRRRRPLVAVNAATLDPALVASELFGHERGAFTGAVSRRIGRLEQAQGGTLFLDEIAELPLDAQAKLLRALEERRFERLGGHDPIESDARLIAATHRDLAALVREGRFREDLLFRLRVVELSLPPLRERAEDIPLLVEHFISVLRERIPTRVRRFSASALDALARYPFPGNVRELKNLVERVLIFAEGEEVEVDDLPGEVRAASADPPAPRVDVHVDEAAHTDAAREHGEADLLPLDALERRQIERALGRSGGNKKEAARLLGIDRATLYGKLKKHGLRP